jgi:murein DD-endopeptidase MepM/ murein hydrolase activator NlpD
MPILLLGGGWASIAPAGRAAFARGAGIELAILSRRLRPESVAAEGADQAAAAARALVRASRLAGVDAREALEAAFPEPRSILGMLALDRDIEDFLDYASRRDALGDYYRDQARISRVMRPFRARYEAVFAAACAVMQGPGRAQGAAAGRSSSVPDRPGRPFIAAPEDVWMPQESELRFAHPYALDVFFRTVDREGEAERGPIIRALYPGIVVATASDWSGGPGPSAWKGGGLSPAAGNGLVIYDPSSRVYCSYFHMSSVVQRPGSVVRAGDSLGRGGNSGVNARKQGHGGHVHLEVFDAARDAPFSSYEILELLKR